MYGQYYDQKKAQPEEPELTKQIVGALMRRFRGIGHPSQQWGNPALDSQILNLDQLAAKYDYSTLMQWILKNHATMNKTHTSRWSVQWNASEVVAASVVETVPVMSVVEKRQVKDIPMNRGILEAGSILEQLNHQLASTIVAMSPPADEKLKEGTKTRPVPCDPKGMVGPSVNALPYLPEVYVQGNLVEESARGGMLYRAYEEKAGGVEGIVSRIESGLNAPPDNVSPLEYHTQICNCLQVNIEQARKQVAPMPRFFNPFKTVQLTDPQGVKKDISRLNYQLTIPEGTFASLDEYYRMQNYIANTCGIESRAGYVYDGHYFADMPPGLARKVHVLGNIMDAVYYCGTPFINYDYLAGPLAKLKTLLPLNLKCMSSSATKVGTEKSANEFHDERFSPGLFVWQGAYQATFRPLEQKAPVQKNKVTVYTPANVAETIRINIKIAPSRRYNLLIYPVYAQPSIWEDKDNFVYPLNFATGMVLVIRGSSLNGISSKTPGHVTMQAYLRLTHRFLTTRIMYPYTRMSWPQVSGMKHARVVLKYGDIGANDYAHAAVISELLGSGFAWGTDDALYDSVQKTDIKIFKEHVGSVVTPKPLIVVPPVELATEEEDPEDPDPVDPAPLQNDDGQATSGVFGFSLDDIY